MSDREALLRAIEDERAAGANDADLEEALKGNPLIGDLLKDGHSLGDIYSELKSAGKAKGFFDAPEPVGPAMLARLKQGEAEKASFLTEALRGASGGKIGSWISSRVQAPFSDKTASEIYDEIEAAHKANLATNPRAAQAGEGVGALLPLTRIGQVGGRALSAGTDLAPSALAPAARFLAGQGGQGAGALNLLLRTGSRASAGALQGALGGAASSEMFTDHPLAEDVKSGAGWGAALGGGIPLALEGLSALGGKISPLVATAIQKANDLGVNLHPLQGSQSSKARGLYNFLTGASQANQNASDYTRALSRTMGGDHANLTDDAMQEIKQNISQRFQSVAQNGYLLRDPQFDRGLGSILTEIGSRPKAAENKNLLKTIDDIRSAFQTAGGSRGAMTGQQYLDMTQKSGAVSDLINSADPIEKEYGIKLRGVLDDLLERSTPAKAGLIQTAREQWKNMMTLLPLIEKAGPDKIVDPTLVKGAVLHGFNQYGFRGAGDLGDLGEAGRLMPRVGVTGESGPAPRTAKIPGWLKIGGAAGLGDALANSPSALGLVQEHPLATAGLAAAAGTAMAAKPALGALVESPWYRNLLLRSAGGEYPGVPPWITPAVGEENTLTSGE